MEEAKKVYQGKEYRVLSENGDIIVLDVDGMPSAFSAKDLEDPKPKKAPAKKKAEKIG